MNKIDLITISEDGIIREAMERINESGIRLAMVVDKEKKLLGIVSDGDIRRALLSGEDLDASVKKIMIKNPVCAEEGASTVELLEMMLSKGIQEIPVIDKQGILKDVVLLKDLKTVPLSNPDITKKEIDVINQVLSTPFLSIGPKIQEFEKKIADYIGTKYAIGVNSGTSGLHLCIRSLDIKEGDEVITSPFSFIASANCALFEKARPVFVDIDENTLCIDADKIEGKITKKTKAILPVHVFGYSCDMDKIMEIAKKHNLAVIEDACEAIGTEYKGKKVGSFGDVGVLAFYPNKQITTAEGGMVLTDDEEIARLCRSLRNQGRDEGNAWLSHSRMGYNYRMSELSAALGTSQIDRIGEIIGKRQRVAQRYNEKLAGLEDVKTPYLSPEVKMSWFVYVIRLDDKKFSQEDRDAIIRALGARGVSSRDYFPPIHLEPFYVKMFGYKKGDFPITEKVSGLTIALPFYNNLTDQEVEYTCESLKAAIEEVKKSKKI